MRNHLACFTLIKDSLEKNIRVRLIYVLESKGSSPGRQGFCMVVNAFGQMQGSLGGGIMEHKFVEVTKHHLQENTTTSHLINQVHNKSSGQNQSGMICDGEQTLFLYDVKKEDIETVASLLKSLQNNQQGTLQLTNNSFSFSEDIPLLNYSYELLADEKFIYKEKTGYKNYLYIIGGGHCSLALSKLMSEMDFYITVYDDRKDLFTMQQNSFAHEKIILNSYEELKIINFPIDNCYVIIMTFGYRTDKVAAEALQGKTLSYLGMLGSNNKIKELRQQFMSQGISHEWLQQIDAPAGLPIKSKTPEEIAISIAAKIIEVKNRD